MCEALGELVRERYADEIAEADETCHGNWIEIQRLYARIDVSEAILRESGIDIPNETFEDLPK